MDTLLLLRVVAPPRGAAARGGGRAEKPRLLPPMRPPERAAWAASMGRRAKSNAKVAAAEARRPHQLVALQVPSCVKAS